MLSCLCGMVKPVILMTVKGRSYWAAYRFVPGDIWVQIRGLGTLLCGIGWWCIVLLVRDRHIWGLFMHSLVWKTSTWMEAVKPNSRGSASLWQEGPPRGRLEPRCETHLQSWVEERAVSKQYLQGLEPSRPYTPCHLWKKRWEQEKLHWNKYLVEHTVSLLSSWPSRRWLAWKNSSIRMGHQSSDWYSWKGRDIWIQTGGSAACIREVQCGSPCGDRDRC